MNNSNLKKVENTREVTEIGLSKEANFSKNQDLEGKEYNQNVQNSAEINQGTENRTTFFLIEKCTSKIKLFNASHDHTDPENE